MQGDGVRELLAAARELGCDYLENEPMRLHTTFKIGGPARVLLFPETEEQITALVQCAKANSVRLLTIGNGSNLLVADKGIDAAVLVMDKHFSAVTVKGDTIFAQAGASLMKVCRTALEHSLTGLEFAYGIPGSCGGAAFMNAGAYGNELKDVLESVTFLDSDLQLRTLPAADLAMGYRTSIFEQNPDWCILSATVVLHRGDGAAVLARMQELLGKRREKQPLEWPSAGSTFKRPQGAFAGKLIEDCGLRGFTVGGAQISEKHCGFVINRGGATCADVVALTEQVRQIVEARTGFVLEREIRVVK